ncbi:hypothetical protein [uncultured Subdoligranulum sp.]|uniref:MuF-C-terminal domain-containing protein n=1 Tax=uncultured Subdoligranulum sp. TaxID=512298 RepID=UPI002613BB99|nr:hypothetical protein [uncultured Subdoligranulum sp.]
MSVSLDYINEVIARNNAGKQAGAMAPASSGNNGNSAARQQLLDIVQRQAFYRQANAAQERAPVSGNSRNQAARQQLLDSMQRQAAYRQANAEEIQKKAEEEAQQREQQRKLRAFAVENRAAQYDAVQEYLSQNEKASALWAEEHALLRDEKTIESLRAGMTVQEQEVYDAAKAARESYGGLYEAQRRVGGLVAGSLQNAAGNVLTAGQTVWEAYQDRQNAMYEAALEAEKKKTGDNTFADYAKEEEDRTAAYSRLMKEKRDTSRTENLIQEENTPGLQLAREGSEQMQRGAAGLSGAGKMAYDLAGSIVANAPSMALALIPGVGTAASLGTMGAQAAGGKIDELSQKGVSRQEALERGVVSGMIEAATEKLPVSSWTKIVKTGGKKALQNILQQALGEGTEEAASYVANWLADMAYRDPEAEFSLQDLAYSAAMGAASGGIYGAVGTGINRAVNTAVRNGKKDGNNTQQSGKQATKGTQPADVLAVAREDELLNQQIPGGQTAQRAAQVQQNAVNAARMQQAEAGSVQSDNQLNQLLPDGQTAQRAEQVQQEEIQERAMQVRKWAEGNESFTPEMRTLAAENYQPEANAALYTTAVQNFYDAGRSGALSYEQAMELNQNRAAVLKQDSVLRRAWELGQKAATPVQDAPGGGRVEGQVQYENGAELNAAMDDTVLQAAAYKLGVNIKVVQELTDDAGGKANGRWAAAMSEIALGENSSNAYQTLAHEMTHYMGSYNPEGWQRLRSSALEWYAQQGGQRTGEDMARYEAAYGDYAKGADEAARDILSGVMSTEGGVRSFLAYLSTESGYTVQEQKTILQTLREMLDTLLEKVRGLLRGGDATVTAAQARQMAERADQLEARRALINDYLYELDNARQNAEQAGLQLSAKENAPAASRSEAEYSINPEFDREIREWDAEGRNESKIFTLGTTSEALQSIGVRDRSIVMLSGKIRKILRDHPGMTMDMIRQIPAMLEHPALVLESQGASILPGTKQNSRIVVVGTVTDAQGNPVLCALDLAPSSRQDMELGLQDFNKVSSAYAKDVNPKGFLKKSNVLYASPDKKITQTVLSSFSFKLASSELNHLSSIGRITYQGGKVNIQGVPFRQVFGEVGSNAEYSREIDSREEAERLRRERDAWLDSEEVRQVRADYERERQMYGLFGVQMKEWKSSNPAWQEYERRRKEYNQKIAALREESREEGRERTTVRKEHPQGKMTGGEQVSYQTLKNLPDMQVTAVQSNAAEGKSVQQLIEDGLNSTQRTYGKKNGRVVNNYTGDTIVVTQDGLRHGLLRKGSVQKNGTYIGKIGQIIENAVKINELEPRGKELRSDVYLGACQDENGTMRAIRFIVNMYENGNATLDGDSLQPLQGSLYAHTSKKGGTAPIKGQGIGTNTVAPDRSNTISIPEFLNSVKEVWGDNLAGTVRYELGIDAQKAGTDNLKEALRYSRKGSDEQELVTERRRRRAAETENRKLARENTRMADQIELLKQETRLSGGHLMDTGAVHDVATRVVQNTHSRYSAAQLEIELRRVYESMSRGKVSGVQEAMETLTDLARGVLSQQRPGVNQAREVYKPLLDKVRAADWTVREGSPLYQDLLDLYGDGPNGKTWGNVRRALFGRMNVRLADESGTSGRIDTLFEELGEEWPGIFDPEAAPADNIQRLMEVYDEVRDGAAYDLETGMSEEEQAAYLAQDLYEAYLSMPRRKTYADRSAAQAEAMAKQFRQKKAQAMAQQKTAYEQKLQEQRKWARDRMTELENQYKAAKEAHDQELVIKTHNQIVKARKQANDVLLRRRAALELQWSNKKERADVTKHRQRVQKSVQALHRWLMKPTEQQHIQTKMQGAVLNLLNSLNMNVGREGTGTAVRWQETMKDIQLMAKDALAADSGLTDTDVYADFDPDLPEMISELMAGTETLDVQTMNSRQLKQLADVLTSMQTSIRNANKMMSDAQGRTVDEIAQESAQEMEKEAGTLLKNRYVWAEKASESRVGIAASQLLGLDMMDARRYFTSLGETAQKKVYEPIRKGFDKRVWLLDSAQNAFDDIVGDTDISQWTGDRAPAQKFELHDGKTIRMTVGQRMELYNLSQRQQAHEHLMQGGITLVDSQGSKKGKRVNITPADLAKIVGSLTNEQVQIARKMSDYLSARDGPAGWGNEVSRQLYGLDKFNERHYWPIKSDSNQTRTSDATDGGTAGFWAIKNQGFTKSLQKYANNSVLVGDAFDTWANHVANMATYNAWSVPLSDAMKWYNWKSGTDVSTKEEIEGIFGKSGKAYFTTLMQDINGMSAKPSTTGLDKFTKEVTRNWKVAKVSANLRVAVQQPTAYIRAAAVMSPKYLAEGLAADVTKLRYGMQMAEEHCAIAKWKSWGYFETNLGQSMKTVLTGEQTALDSVREVGTKLAELGDQVTWGTLWNACEAEARAKGMKTGTEGFNQYCADRLSEIVDKTQVVDSVLHRSHIMRSKNPLAQMSTNFFAEPTKSYSMMAEAWTNVVHGKKDAKKNFARATATYALTALGTAAAASLIDAARVSRDEDRDKEYDERYLEKLWENFRDGVKLLNNIPLVKDILSIAQGYDATRSDMEMFSDMISAVDSIQKAQEGDITPYRLTYQVATALSSLTGIPMSSAVREAKSAYDMITDLQDPLRLDRKMNRAEDDYSYIDLYNQVKAAGGDKDEFKALYQGKTYGEMLGTDKAKAVDNWVQALAKNSGKEGEENKAVLPKHLNNEISYTDSEGTEHKVVLKGPDYIQYAKSLQSAAVNLIDEYMRTAGATATTGEQARFVTLAKEYAQETARETVISGYEAKDWVARVQTLSGGKNIAAMIQARQIVNGAEGEKDADGKTISGSKVSNAVEQLQKSLGYSAGEAQALYNNLRGSEENTYMKLYKDVESNETQIDKLAALYGTGEAATYSGMLQNSGAAKVDNYLQNLSKSQGKEVLPDRAATKFNARGEEVELSGKQYIDYAQKRTQTAYNILNELIPNAGNYTKEEQAGFVSKVEDYATQIAKADVSDFEPYKWMQEVQQRAGNDSQQLYDLIMAKTLIDSAEGQKGANGKTISGSKKAAAIQSMQDAGYSAAMAQQMYKLFG